MFLLKNASYSVRHFVFIYFLREINFEDKKLNFETKNVKLVTFIYLLRGIFLHLIDN